LIIGHPYKFGVRSKRVGIVIPFTTMAKVVEKRGEVNWSDYINALINRDIIGDLQDAEQRVIILTDYQRKKEIERLERLKQLNPKQFDQQNYLEALKSQDGGTKNESP